MPSKRGKIVKKKRVYHRNMENTVLIFVIIDKNRDLCLSLSEKINENQKNHVFFKKIAKKGLQMRFSCVTITPA